MEKEFKILDQIIENAQHENDEIKYLDNESNKITIENFENNEGNNSHENSYKTYEIIEEKLLEAISKDYKNSQDDELLESQFEERKIIHKNKNKEFKKEFYEYLRKQSKYIF